MSNTIVLITGANRGLGLHFTRKYLERGWTVYAAARNPERSSDLQSLREKYGKQLSVLTLESRDDDSIQAAVRQMERTTSSLDLLINNAGRYGSERHSGDIASLDLNDILKTFDTNTLGPLRVTRACLPLLKKGKAKKVIHITSLMGSIEDNSSGGSYGYRLSKAALNMLSKNLSHDLRAEKITSIVLHPGWVQTDMGGAAAPMTIQESMSGMIRVIDDISFEQSGQFFRHDGTKPPY